MVSKFGKEEERQQMKLDMEKELQEEKKKNEEARKVFNKLFGDISDLMRRANEQINRNHRN